MMIISAILIFLAFFGAALPVPLLSIIWGDISDRLTVPVASVGILRAALALGAVLACVFGEKVLERFDETDLTLLGMILEAFSVIGFSLSRLFWNICAWSVSLGLGLGLTLQLLSLFSVRIGRKKAMAAFAGSAAGVAAGAELLDVMHRRALSWRTDCQLLGLAIVLIVCVLFLVRRSLQQMAALPEMPAEEEEESRAGTAAEENPRRACTMFLTVCASASCLGLASALCVLWSGTYRSLMFDSSAENMEGEILAFAAALAIGRIAAALLPLRRKAAAAAGLAIAAAALIASQVLIRQGTPGREGLLCLTALTGFGMGPLFPLLLREGRRAGEEDSIFRGLLPAFYLAPWVLLTPLTQALVGADAVAWYPLPLLILLCLAAPGLLLPWKRKEKAERPG